MSLRGGKQASVQGLLPRSATEAGCIHQPLGWVLDLRRYETGRVLREALQGQLQEWIQGS